MDIPAGNVKEIKNNILIATMDGVYFAHTPTDKTGIDYNCYHGMTYPGSDAGGEKSWVQWTDAGYEKGGTGTIHGINVDPSLDANYAPDSVSDPVVNAGVTVATVTTDKNGVARPQGAKYDIGAYEYDEDEGGNVVFGTGGGLMNIGTGGIITLE